MPSSILTVFLIVRFPMTETRPVHGKLDYHVSAGRKRDGYQQLPVSVEFTKYGNTLFRPVILIRYRFTNERETASYILFSAKSLLFLFSFIIDGPKTGLKLLHGQAEASLLCLS